MSPNTTLTLRNDKLMSDLDDAFNRFAEEVVNTIQLLNNLRIDTLVDTCRMNHSDA